MPSNSDLYNSDFYSEQGQASDLSAQIMVPFLVKSLSPASVVDIGCGAGYWPRAFARAGVAVAHGLDGPWARSATVLTPGTDLFECDLGQAPLPLQPALPQSRYDLVTSFEFVEHIAPERAEGLVDLFCSLSDVVVLGGAIPHQSGVHHVNEQWPEYWAALFAARGYACCDFIRPAFWDTAQVEPWYVQNTVAYFKGGVPPHVSELARSGWMELAGRPASLVHPALWNYAHPPLTLRRAAFDLARALKRAIAG